MTPRRTQDRRAAAKAEEVADHSCGATEARGSFHCHRELSSATRAQDRLFRFGQVQRESCGRNRPFLLRYVLYAGLLLVTEKGGSSNVYLY